METSAKKSNKNVIHFPLSHGMYVELRRWRGEPRLTITYYERSHRLNQGNGTLNKKKSINLSLEQLDRLVQSRNLIHTEYKKLYERLMFDSLKLPRFYTPQHYPVPEREEETQNINLLCS